MKTLEATFRVVTPMFIGGAEPDKEAELRAPSVKGVLRFWWRTLNWGKFIQEEDNEDENKAIGRLRDEEALIFGSSAGKSSGQGIFSLQIARNDLGPINETWPKQNSHSGYLGIGIWESGSVSEGNFKPHRKGFSENKSFSIKLLFKPGVPLEKIQSVTDAIIVFGLCGGLGSRSRRAFGSVALENINGKKMTFENSSEYQQVLYNLLKKYPTTEKKPPFSAFSNQTTIGLFKGDKDTARKAHSMIGEKYKSYRSKIPKNRKQEKRILGLPYKGISKAYEDARRASPLFFHVHPIGKKFSALAILMPASFHPDEAIMKVDWKLAKDFFKDLKEICTNGK